MKTISNQVVEQRKKKARQSEGRKLLSGYVIAFLFIEKQL